MRCFEGWFAASVLLVALIISTLAGGIGNDRVNVATGDVPIVIIAECGDAASPPETTTGENNKMTETTSADRPLDALIKQIRSHLSQLAPHVKERPGGRLLEAAYHELITIRAAIDDHNAAQAQGCDWRQGHSQCDAYLVRGKRCSDCPRGNILEIVDHE